MRVIIDRFEGTYAVCEKEDRKMINIERVKIPTEAREGDMLLIEEDSIVIDKAGTEKRKSDIQKLMDDLWE